MTHCLVEMRGRGLQVVVMTLCEHGQVAKSQEETNMVMLAHQDHAGSVLAGPWCCSVYVLDPEKLGFHHRLGGGGMLLH